MSLIHLKDVNKTYQGAQPLHVLKGIDLDIERGEFVSIMGASGSGKSTLLKMVAGLEEPDSGRIVRGRNLDIRYLPQNPVFHPGETVLESVLRENEGHEHVWDIESQAKSMLNRLGIPDFNEKVEHLSGGQKKRAALASVLLSTAVFP